MHHPVTIGIIVAVPHDASVNQALQPEKDPFRFLGKNPYTNGRAWSGHFRCHRTRVWHFARLKCRRSSHEHSGIHSPP